MRHSFGVRIATAVAGAMMLSSAASVGAQSLSFGLRGTGGFPTGAFAETSGSANGVVLAGAKSGFGYGLDVGVSMGVFGVYAGFDHINFDCGAASCSTDAKYKLQGVSVGARITPTMAARLHPFIKGGVTFNTLEGVYGGSSAALTTDRTPGYELGLGGNIALGGLLSLSPQVRYVGQNFKAKIPGVTVTGDKSDGANYFTFDLGLSVTTPFGGGKR